MGWSLEVGFARLFLCVVRKQRSDGVDTEVDVCAMRRIFQSRFLGILGEEVGLCVGPIVRTPVDCL